MGYADLNIKNGVMMIQVLGFFSFQLKTRVHWHKPSIQKWSEC